MRVFVRRILPLVTIGGITAVVLALVAAAAFTTAGGAVHAAASTSSGQSLCIGHHPQDFVWYTGSCTGHDEPGLDPLSNHAGSAQDLTWRVILPSDGSTVVDAVGPTFWIGGAVTDPNSLDNQAFLELQFYPNSYANNCAAGGGYNVSYVPGDYTACSPVWEVSKTGNSESAAFNAMLTDSKTGGPLVLHAGDTMTDHQYVTAAADGMHITVSDLTTGHSGTIILDSKGGRPTDACLHHPATGQLARLGVSGRCAQLLRVGDRAHQQLHHSRRQILPPRQRDQACLLTRQRGYSARLPSVADRNGHVRRPQRTAGVGVSQRLWRRGGNEASIAARPTDERRFCGYYPWYTLNKTGGSSYYTYGGDYPNVVNDFGQAAQFQLMLQCPSLSGPDTTYCATVLK